MIDLINKVGILTKDVVRIGDLYFVGCAHSQVIPCEVIKIDKKGFEYRVLGEIGEAYQLFDDIISFRGFLIKEDERKIKMYTTKKTLNELKERIKIENGN